MLVIAFLCAFLYSVIDKLWDETIVGLNCNKYLKFLGIIA